MKMCRFLSISVVLLSTNLVSADEPEQPLPFDPQYMGQHEMVLMSSVFAVVVGVGAYYILMSTEMDTANVMSSINVRLSN